MKAWTRDEQFALLDAAALVSVVVESAAARDAEHLNAVLDAVVTDLGRTRDTVVATAFGVVVALLLDRLAEATGRPAAELWNEVATGMAASITRKG